MSATTTLDDAMQALQSGDAHRGFEMVRGAARRLRESQGELSPEFAAAMFEVAQYAMAAGDTSAAIEALRDAAAVPATSGQAAQDRLTYLRNLGEILLMAGRRDEAEQMLLRGLDERRKLYGPKHAGYAFGLEPLAEVAWRGGDHARALTLADEAWDILMAEGNIQFASVVALRAFILHDQGTESTAFPDFEKAPEVVAEAIVNHVLDRADRYEPPLGVAVIDDLINNLESVHGPRGVELLRPLASLSESARKADDLPARVDAIGRMIAVSDAHRMGEQALVCLQGLAMALDEAGDPEGAERTYRDAIERAGRLGDDRRLAGILRNLGIFLGDRDRAEEGRATLARALEVAERSGDAETIGRSLIALGIRDQHDGRLDEAGPMLARAITMLPTDHPDALTARSHLAALRSGQSCGCNAGTMADAVSEALKALVVPHLPEGLLEEIRIDPEEGLRVQLARKPTDEEAALLNDVIRHAMRQLQQKGDRAGLSS